MSRPLSSGREEETKETADAIDDADVTSRVRVSMPCAASGDSLDGFRAVA